MKTLELFGRRKYSVTIMCSNGAELTSQTEARNLLECIGSVYIKTALLKIPGEIKAVGILVYEVGK